MALRDAAATFIRRIHESFRFLAPSIFRGRDLDRDDYLHVDVTLCRRPDASPEHGDDTLSGVINAADVRTRSSWSRSTAPPWSVRSSLRR